MSSGSRSMILKVEGNPELINGFIDQETSHLIFYFYRIEFARGLFVYSYSSDIPCWGGDEPCEVCWSNSLIPPFPANAGINRYSIGSRAAESGIPRERGAGPLFYQRTIGTLQHSLRTRG